MNKFFISIEALFVIAVMLTGCPGMNAPLRPLADPGEAPDIEFPTEGGTLLWEQNFNAMEAVNGQNNDLLTWESRSGLSYYAAKPTSATSNQNSVSAAVTNAGNANGMVPNSANDNFLSMNKPNAEFVLAGPDTRFIMAKNFDAPVSSGQLLFEMSFCSGSLTVNTAQGDFEGTGVSWPKIMLYAASELRDSVTDALKNPIQTQTGLLGLVFDRNTWQINTIDASGEPASYVASTWYGVRMIFDLDANLYRVEVKRPDGTAIFNSGGSLGNNFSQIVQAGFYMQNVAGGMGIDDLKLTIFN